MIDLLSTLGLVLVLGRLAWLDIRTYRLPDRYTLPLIAFGLVLGSRSGGIDLSTSAIGGIVGYSIFWFVGAFYFKRNGVEGLGLGDAKLFAASGTWLGYMLLPYVLLLAAVGGLVFAVLRRTSQRRQIAFGPWLCLGFLILWLEATFNLVGLI
jgi:leader peptidase (prepilin peptidase)/N-methyltransferase